jgi:hypothetical protein
MRRLPALAACLALVACTHAAKPKPIDGVERFDGLAHTHVGGDVQYPQTPPVGGPHSNVWLRCGVYDVPIPNVNAVHSMEHGAVWITYRPGLPQADVDAIKKLQLVKPAFILISPFPGLPSPVVASAWGLQLTVDRADDPRLRAFVQAYAGGAQGGEPGTRCDNGATLDQAKQFNATTATASPTPPAS